MRAKKVNQVHTCKECKHATPDMKYENLSIFGEPTLVSCIFSRWKQNINQQACERFG